MVHFSKVQGAGHSEVNSMKVSIFFEEGFFPGSFRDSFHTTELRSSFRETNLRNSFRSFSCACTVEFSSASGCTCAQLCYLPRTHHFQIASSSSSSYAFFRMLSVLSMTSMTSNLMASIVFSRSVLNKLRSDRSDCKGSGQQRGRVNTRAKGRSILACNRFDLLASDRFPFHAWGA